MRRKQEAKAQSLGKLSLKFTKARYMVSTMALVKRQLGNTERVTRTDTCTNVLHY